VKWRSGYTWALFLGGAAIMAYVTQDRWSDRVLAFLIITVPLSVWAKRGIARAHVATPQSHGDGGGAEPER
jgi:hypothetical protein